jgi:hypothetical protein
MEQLEFCSNLLSWSIKLTLITSKEQIKKDQTEQSSQSKSKKFYRTLQNT